MGSSARFFAGFISPSLGQCFPLFPRSVRLPSETLVLGISGFGPLGVGFDTGRATREHLAFRSPLARRANQLDRFQCLPLSRRRPLSSWSIFSPPTGLQHSARRFAESGSAVIRDVFHLRFGRRALLIISYFPFYADIIQCRNP